MRKIILEELSTDDLKALIMETFIEAQAKNQVPNHPKPDEDGYLMTRKEVASLLKISYVTLNEWTKIGKINAYSLGKNRVRYKRDEVLKMLRSSCR